MIRWVAVIFIALIVFPALLPVLQKYTWRLRGDVKFKLAGIVWCLPFATTLAVSAAVFLIAEIADRTCLFC